MSASARPTSKQSGVSTCAVLCVAFSSVFFVGVAAVLLYFGLAYKTATCAEPLAVWCLVAGSTIAVAVAALLADYFMGVGRCQCCWPPKNEPKPEWSGLVYLLSDEGGSRKKSSWFTIIAIVEVTVLVVLVFTFLFGAYAVLAMFGRQRNATPGTEVCDRRLYDPLFFIIILFDLVMVIATLLAICLNCDPLCCCWSDKAAAAKKHDDAACCDGSDGDDDEEARLIARRREADRTPPAAAAAAADAESTAGSATGGSQQAAAAAPSVAYAGAGGSLTAAAPAPSLPSSQPGSAYVSAAAASAPPGSSAAHAGDVDDADDARRKGVDARKGE